MGQKQGKGKLTGKSCGNRDVFLRYDLCFIDAMHFTLEWCKTNFAGNGATM